MALHPAEGGLFIIPTPDAAGDENVQRDCMVANALFHRLMCDNPDLPAADAFEQVKRQTTRVCVFQWHRMMLQNLCGAESTGRH